MEHKDDRAAMPSEDKSRVKRKYTKRKKSEQEIKAVVVYQEKPKKKMGRPQKEINERSFIKLCAIHCTCEEIAGFFDVSIPTIDRWCKRVFNSTFEDALKKYSAGGRACLRRAQWRAALIDKSTTMQIWLGKQNLGQRDAPEGVTDKDAIREFKRALAYQEKAEQGDKP